MVQSLNLGSDQTDCFKDIADGPEMVVVPAGEFLMGSPRREHGHCAAEAPQHPVRFAKPFAVGRFAVTFDEWDAAVSAGGCGGYVPDDHGWGRGDLPVINVSWSDAKAYLRWLRDHTGSPYRLTSEAEWEYVARAGTTTPFCWGSDISTERANYHGTYTYGGGPKSGCLRRTVPVSSYDANPWGLYGLHGNVWEWTEDCFCSNYGEAPTDGSAQLHDPLGDFDRVIRGGSWLDRPKELRSAVRMVVGVDYRSYHIGFRVALTLD